MDRRREYILLVGACALAALTGYLMGASSSERTVKNLSAQLATIRSQVRPSGWRPESHSQSLHSSAQVGGDVPIPKHEITSGATATERFQQRTDEVMRRGREEHVARVAQQEEAADRRVFLELGLSPEKAEQFHSNKVQLHRMTIAAVDPLQKLMEARAKYDREVEAALGAEYPKYRKYEESKPAEREYDLLQQFLMAEKEPPIDAMYYQVMIDLIRESGATTTESWHNPYDPAPRPRVGAKAIAENRRERIPHLEQTIERLSEKLAQSQLPEHYHGSVLKYYRKRLDDLHQSLARALRPEDQVKADLERISREQIERVRAQKGAVRQ